VTKTTKVVTKVAKKKKKKKSKARRGGTSPGDIGDHITKLKGVSKKAMGFVEGGNPKELLCGGWGDEKRITRGEGLGGRKDHSNKRDKPTPDTKKNHWNDG